jgi:hypothetical protein
VEEIKQEVQAYGDKIPIYHNFSLPQVFKYRG